MFDAFLFKSAHRIISLFLILSLAFSPALSYAQSTFITTLPEPGKIVNVSPVFTPVLVKGLVVHPDKPLNFDFIVDSGNDSAEQIVVKEQSEKIVRYFLAALTVPEEQLWVNLSPYEKDRIIDEGLGQTVLGRDMLAQDYVLKQLTASLIYPEDNLGKDFWGRIYKEAQDKFGTTVIPVDTFNKVWIVPQKAEVFEKDNAVYVTQARLKVMLDSDYLAAGVGATSGRPLQATDGLSPASSEMAKQLIREIILPAIEKEVNEGKNFAALRQIYHAAILAKWYRELIQDTLISKAYVGQNKISGVNSDDKTIKEQIYQRYIAAYKQGVFNYIKDETDVVTGETTPRKYFSGGLDKFGDIKLDKAQSPNDIVKVGKVFKVDFAMDSFKNLSDVDKKIEAMKSAETNKDYKLYNQISDELFALGHIGGNFVYKNVFIPAVLSEDEYFWDVSYMSGGWVGGGQEISSAHYEWKKQGRFDAAMNNSGSSIARNKAARGMSFKRKLVTWGAILALVGGGVWSYKTDYFNVRSPFDNVSPAFAQSEYWYPRDISARRVVIGDINSSMDNHGLRLETQGAEILPSTAVGGAPEFKVRFKFTNTSAKKQEINSIILMAYGSQERPLKIMEETPVGNFKWLKPGDVWETGISGDLIEAWGRQVSIVVVREDGVVDIFVVAGIHQLFEKYFYQENGAADRAMADIQVTSSALSVNVDPAMINEVVQWIQSNPIWTVAGVVASLSVIVRIVRSWKLKKFISSEKQEQSSGSNYLPEADINYEPESIPDVRYTFYDGFSYRPPQTYDELMASSQEVITNDPDAAMVDIQVTSSALSANADPAMINDALQYLQEYPGLIVLGVLFSVGTVGGFYLTWRDWWLDNTVAGNIKKYNKWGSKDIAIKFFIDHKDRGGKNALIRLWQRNKAEDLAKALYTLGWAPQELNERILFLVSVGAWNELVKAGSLTIPELAKLWQSRKSDSDIAKVLFKLGWTPQQLNEKILFLVSSREWDELVKIGFMAVPALIDSEQWDAVTRVGSSAIPFLFEKLYDRYFDVSSKMLTAVEKLILGDVEWSTKYQNILEDRLKEYILALQNTPLMITRHVEEIPKQYEPNGYGNGGPDWQVEGTGIPAYDYEVENPERDLLSRKIALFQGALDRIKGENNAELSSALSENAPDAAMINEVVQWAQNNPALTIMGVVASTTIALKIVKVWRRINEEKERIFRGLDLHPKVVGQINLYRSDLIAAFNEKKLYKIVHDVGETYSDGVDYTHNVQPFDNIISETVVIEKDGPDSYSGPYSTIGFGSLGSWGETSINSHFEIEYKERIELNLVAMQSFLKMLTPENAKARIVARIHGGVNNSSALSEKVVPKVYTPSERESNWTFEEDIAINSDGQTTGNGYGWWRNKSTGESQWGNASEEPGKGRSDSAQDGGIDIQNIDVNKTGNAKIKFNDDALKQVLSGGFDGFAPVFIKMTPLESPLMALGLN